MIHTKREALVNDLYSIGINTQNKMVCNVPYSDICLIKQSPRCIESPSGAIYLSRQLTLEEKLSTFTPTPEWSKAFSESFVEIIQYNNEKFL